MNEITHCHNQRPIYECGNRHIYDWDAPVEVSGKQHTVDYPTYHPVVFDIETSAELEQRPILCVAYDSLRKDVIILYSYGYQGYTIDSDTAKSMLSDFDYNNVIVDNLSQSKFEEYILKPINDWNQKAQNKSGKHRKSLVAHNASFDIPMMGTPDDGLLELPQIGEQYEMAVRYNDYNMIGHRAGQFGAIYQFLDRSNEYDALHIPVGDTMVAAQSLYIPASLGAACRDIGVSIDVSEADSHGNLSDEYIDYCINDVYATYRLYENLSDRLDTMFGDLPIESIYSTASIGKYVLKSMGYNRVGYTTDAVDRIAPSYFGGRTDAEITGEIVENVDYTDILSEYPTVSALTNVWQYMQAKTVDVEQIDPDNLPDVGDLRKQDTWGDIADYYVKIRANGAILPVRTPHLDDTTKVVTANVHTEKELHYHYMDIIAAELIDDNPEYEIVAAWKVIKNGNQSLSQTSVADVSIEPEDNVMAKCIEARKNIQLSQGYKDNRTLALKIVANSLYGCSAERIVKEIDGEKHDIASDSGFYNPHVAATITAGGRLMIALGESKAKEYGGELLYCDTDSFIVPNHVTDNLIEDFNELNPYSGKSGDLDVLEKEKETGNLYATGEKKYIFFSDSGKPLEVKEHGLGNYENLRDYEKICRLWATIIYYDTETTPLQPDILYEDTLNEPVMWSFNASTKSMRKIVQDMSDCYVRYGDWIHSTISFDDEIRYLATNLEEKTTNDTVAKVTMSDTDPVEVTTAAYTDMMTDNRLKTVRDIVMKFVEESATPDARPDVIVTDLKPVTKESTNRKDIFTANLEKQFANNLLDIRALPA